MDNSNSNDGTLFKWVSSIALPLAIAFSGFVISASVEDSKVGSDYVRLAVDILSAEPSKSIEQETKQKALKGWAVRVLNKHSPVEMTLEEMEAFNDSYDLVSFSKVFSHANTQEAIDLIDEAMKELKER